MDFSSLVDAASFDTVATAILALAALMIVVVFVRWGAKKVMEVLR